MFGKLGNVCVNADDLGVQVSLELFHRTNGIPRVQNGGGGHPEYLRPVRGSDMFVLAHNTIVRMILPRMVAFIENNQRDLSKGSVSDAATWEVGTLGILHNE